MPHSWLLLPAVVPVVTVLGIDNGIGLTPPRGWRSWNAFDCLEPRSILTQAHVKAQMDAVLDKSRLVDGKPTSLAELGFDWISMDDGWQRCNCSVRQDLDPKLPKCDGNLCFGGHCSWHDAAGVPVVRKDRFPNMKELVDYGHAHELKVGTYLNTCICNEHGSPHYSEDVKWMQDLGFDGVKIDSCGSSNNVTRWAELFNQTGKAIRIENCHNSWPDFETGFCPMNFFRTGGDISADISSILNEAYATVDAADLPKPRSGPGCWAYPDMSEVGNFQSGPHREDQERTHWALWCIVSSPLILGFDMNDTATMDRVWPTITNRDALAISEAWVGNPGTLIRSYPSQHSERQLAQGRCDGSGQSAGFSFSGAKRGKLVAPKMAKGQEPLCVTTQSAPCPPPTSYAPDVRCGLMLRNCSTVKNQWIFADGRIQLDDQSQGKCLYSNRMDFDTTKGYFTRKAATVGLTACPHAQNFTEPGCAWQEEVKQRRASWPKPPAASANTDFALTPKGELQNALGCLHAAPVGGIQLWAKPLSDSSTAILLINPSAENEALAWPVADLPQRFSGAEKGFRCQPARCGARDVWAGRRFAVSDEIHVSLKPWGSTFLILHSEDTIAV